MAEDNGQGAGGSAGADAAAVAAAAAKAVTDKGSSSSAVAKGGSSGNGDAGAAAGSSGNGAASKTILAEGGTDRQAAPAADWPADWRQKLAGEDKSFLATLERYGSPTDLANKIREQDKLIAQGKHKSGLAKDATPEQLAAYRKENGIPETADKYDLKLADGLVIGEADKPIVDNLLKNMHAMNLNNDQVKSLMGAYYQQEKEFLQERDNQIADKKTQQDDQLHKDWGQEYRQNLNIVGTLNKTWSQETRNALAGAVDSEGFPLLNNPAFLKDLAVMARTINPIDTVVGSHSGNQMSSVVDELKKISDFRKKDRNAYFKDEGMQKRERELLDWQSRQKK